MTNGVSTIEAMTEQEEKRKQTKQHHAVVPVGQQTRNARRHSGLRQNYVDGGHLTTMGIYAGPEDFDKDAVRQLQIDRLLAPFWRGLSDHSNGWTEHQLIAAVRGRQDAPLDIIGTAEECKPKQPNRWKTIFKPTSTSALTSRSYSNVQKERIQHDTHVNSMPIEAYLYREVSECPICFLYYPSYLNRSSCCNQPICSECFVQFKRPEPHAPKQEQSSSRQDKCSEALQCDGFVSEAVPCPFCLCVEFGVTYSPPSFHIPVNPENSKSAHPTGSINMQNVPNWPSIPPKDTLPADHSSLITPDKIRPQWKQKLEAKRRVAATRSAKATAMHRALINEQL